MIRLHCKRSHRISKGTKLSTSPFALGPTETTPMIKSLVIAILLVALPVLAMAQQQGTAQERKACSPDVKRHCSKIVDQGDLVILSCLKENRQKLSSACNKVLLSHGQ
jgi:hypothetical protein